MKGCIVNDTGELMFMIIVYELNELPPKLRFTVIRTLRVTLPS